MARVIVRKLAPKRGAAKKPAAGKTTSTTSAANGGVSKASVTLKSVRGANGQRFKVWAIDANSPTFADDLSTVFARNVSKARKENTERFGDPDRVARKAR
jgi:hypothetical protein